MTPRRLLAGLLALSLSSGSCAAPPDEPRGPVPQAPTDIPAPPWMPMGSASTSPDAAVPPSPPEPSVDLSAVWSLRRDPTFVDVVQALDAAKLDLALAALDRLVAAEPSAPPGRRALTTYVHATLLERAGKPAAALARYLEVTRSTHPLADAARLRGARLQASLGRDQDAVELASTISPQAFDEREVLSTTAVSLARAAPIDRVRAACEALYLPSGARRPGWSVEGLRVLGALARRKEREAVPLALELGDALILDSPRGRVAGDAEKLVRTLEARLEYSEQKARRADDAATRIRRAERLAASGQEKKAVAILDRLAKPVEKLAEADPTRCRYHLARGRALGLVKRKSEAWQSFDEAGRVCSELRPAEALDRARAAAKAGDVDAAARLYAAFEASHPGHELADDARLEAARALGARGATEAAAKLLVDFVERYPKGDRTRDAVFERVLAALVTDDRPALRAALAAEASVQLPPERVYDRAGRFAYFRGRLAALEGATDRARAAYELTIAEHPLGYYAALALAELEALERGSASTFLRTALTVEATRRPLGLPTRRTEEPAVALALALAGAGDAELTEHCLRGLRRREPSNAAWRSVGAELLVLAGDPQRAHAFIRTARERDVPADEATSAPFLAELPRAAHRSVYLAAYPRLFEAELARAAAESGAPLELLFAVAREESAFLPKALSVSDARGLLQVIPPTASRMARSLGIRMTKDTLYDPAANARIGARYLAMLSKRFAPMTPLAIAGYNAGPGAPEKWLEEATTQRLDLFVEQIPYAETRGYVKRVWSSYFAYLVLYDGDRAPLFVTSTPLRGASP